MRATPIAMSSTAIRRANLRLYRRVAWNPLASTQQDQNLSGRVDHQGGGKNRGKKRHPDTEGTFAMPVGVLLGGSYHKFALPAPRHFCRQRYIMGNRDDPRLSPL